MRDRSPATGAPTTSRTAARRHLITTDLVLLTPHGRELTMLLRRAGSRGRERWELPWSALTGSETLDVAAARLARAALGAAPAHLEQVGAVDAPKRHPAGTGVAVAYFGLAPAGTPAPVGGAAAWFPVRKPPALPARHAGIVERALDAVRARLDDAPIAFRLLPAEFTLSQLQEIYEVLLGRALHKASFRRALQAAHLVEPLEEWRTEGRGRPAQLFRYAPRRRRGDPRGVRFAGS
jgi:8-oxo-dGTP diphosphatase